VKFQLFQKTVTFLGYKIDEAEIHVSDKRIEKSFYHTNLLLKRLKIVKNVLF